MTEHVAHIPTPALVVLVGAAGSGKTTWATATFGPDAVISSDRLRAVVGEGEHDQSASADAFDLLARIVAARLGRGLTTVVDTIGLEPEERARWRDAAATAGMTSVLVAFDTPAALATDRNRGRDRTVPASVQRSQLARFRAQRPTLPEEGFDVFHVVADHSTPTPTRTAAMHAVADRAASQRADPVGLAFGLHLSSFDFVGDASSMAATLTDIARTAEEVGFSSLRVMDHPVQIPQVGRHWDPMLEPFTTLAHLAAATDTIRLGPLVAGITYRNIAMLGKTVATLDVLSGGRVECGLGLGWFERDHVAYGIDLPPVDERYARLEDALAFLPVLWGPGTKPWTGATFSTPEAICYPRPLQERIPLLVGGSGERRTLALVARAADACNLFGTPEVVARRIGVLAQHCRAVDRDPAEVRVTHLAEALTAPDAESLDALVRARGPNRRVDAWKSRVNAGTADDQIGRFRALADAGVDEAIVAVPGLQGPDDVARFAPVIAAFG